MIEVFIRAEDGLCREVVKHLNEIEEQILDHLAWKPESPLWDRIRDNDNRVPTCEEVCENILASSITKVHQCLVCSFSVFLMGSGKVVARFNMVQSPIYLIGNKNQK